MDAWAVVISVAAPCIFVTPVLIKSLRGKVVTKLKLEQKKLRDEVEVLQRENRQLRGERNSFQDEISIYRREHFHLGIENAQLQREVSMLSNSFLEKEAELSQQRSEFEAEIRRLENDIKLANEQHADQGRRVVYLLRILEVVVNFAKWAGITRNYF